MSLEDRHTISEPRPVVDGTDENPPVVVVVGNENENENETSSSSSSSHKLPTWEVDIFREGVDTPIMTLQINARNLPPRIRKKKIIWKLPDTIHQIPKFGFEDKKRILDLFKHYKKELKKTTKKQKYITTTTTTTNTTETGKDGANETTSPAIMGKSETIMGMGDQDHSLATESIPDYQIRGSPSKTSSPDILSSFSSSNAPTSMTVPQPQPPPKPPIASPPPGFGQSFAQLSLRDEMLPKHGQDTKLSHSTVLQTKTNEPSQQQTSLLPPPPPPPPPGLVLDRPPGITVTAAASAASASPPTREPMSQTTTTTTTAPTDLPSIGDPSHLPPPPPPPPSQMGTLHFLVPPHSSVAHIVPETYYRLLTQGLLSELLAHYTPTAQKSLTVGGAHAVCHSRRDCALQLQSLVGMLVQIRGVIQQPTIGGAILIVITGTCRQPHPVLPFCHSLVLLPSTRTTMTMTMTGTTAGPSIDGSTFHHDGLGSTTNAATTTATTSTAGAGVDAGTGGNGGATISGYQIQNDALCFLLSEDDGDHLSSPSSSSS